jgi:hypothetical protein
MSPICVEKGSLLRDWLILEGLMNFFGPEVKGNLDEMVDVSPVFVGFVI